MGKVCSDITLYYSVTVITAIVSGIQWNPSITATIGNGVLALIERWPLERGPAFFFCCLHALVTYLHIQLSL